MVTEQIERAADIYHTWQSEGTDGTNYEVPELCRSVGIDEIESKGWTLTPSKYIEFIDRDLDIDYEKEMARIQAEMKEVLAQEKKSQQMLEDAFRGLVMELTKYKLGKLIEQCDNRNTDEEYTADDVRGISTGKEFIETKANMDGVSLTSYKIVKENEFAYVADTSRRGDKIAVAFNRNEGNILISSIYTVFM